jgi:hypothetical protein
MRSRRGPALRRADLIERDTRVQLSVTGKDGRVRQVLLPKNVSRSLLQTGRVCSGNFASFAPRMEEPLRDSRPCFHLQ